MKYALHLALAVSTAAACLAAVPAHAQYANKSGGSIKIQKDALEQVRWFKGRRIIQITDEGPEVHDLRARPTNDTVEIAIPPLAPGGQSAAGTIPAGGLKLPGGGGTIVTGPALPSSRFGTNIPAGGMRAQSGLPGGRSTNMLAGKMAGMPQIAEQTARVPKAAAPAAIKAQSVAGYGSYNTQGASSAGGQKTSSSVSGKLMKRGSLLDR